MGATDRIMPIWSFYVTDDDIIFVHVILFLQLYSGLCAWCFRFIIIGSGDSVHDFSDVGMYDTKTAPIYNLCKKPPVKRKKRKKKKKVDDFDEKWGLTDEDDEDDNNSDEGVFIDEPNRY